MSMRNSLPRVLLASLLITAVQPAGAQGFLDRVKRAAKEAATRKAEQGAADAANKAADAAAGTIKCIVTDTDCIDEAKAAGKQPVLVDQNGNPAAAPGSTAAAVATNAGNDFTPGTRVIFADDFRGDEIGNFPRGVELKSGNMEVADVGGTRYLRATGFGEFDIQLPEVLPQQFTMEFDFTGSIGWEQEIYFTDKDDTPHLALRPGSPSGISGPHSYQVMSNAANNPGKNPFPVKVMADGPYVKVYVNGTRVANAPNATLGRSRVIRFKVRADQHAPALFGNFRIAAGGKDLYKTLSDAGRVTTEGIFFDTGSDRIRPESAPALKEIGDMLQQHPDLRVSIEGHTDNVGSAAANMALSDKRAAAVKNYLVNSLGVNAARLTSKGYGDAKPVADNATPEGRQKNRRVELVKQ